MRAPASLVVLALACAPLAACGGKVSPDSTDGGTSGASACDRFCHAFDGTTCGKSLDIATCLTSCGASLAACDAETRAFLDCALRPGVLTCGPYGPGFAGCEAAATTLVSCTSKSDAGGSTSSSGSAPSP